jgi:DNA-binding transcriptional LysR family regulator
MVSMPRVPPLLTSRLDQQNRVEISDVAGETYLRRINCEYRDYLADRLRALGLAVRVGFQSEREDWIQKMVAAGFGVCFLPEYSPTIPGVRTQPVTDPEVTGLDVGAALFTGGDDLCLLDPVPVMVAFMVAGPGLRWRVNLQPHLSTKARCRFTAR